MRLIEESFAAPTTVLRPYRAVLRQNNDVLHQLKFLSAKNE